MVDEGIRSEFIAIVNYGIIGLIQLELGYAAVSYTHLCNLYKQGENIANMLCNIYLYF